MASKWYLRPSSSSEAHTALPYHPSASIDWEQAFPNGHSIPRAPPPVPQSIADRNEAVVQALSREVRTKFEENGELMRRIRARQKGWSNYDASDARPTENSLQLADAQAGQYTRQALYTNLPRAFRFHQQPARMHRLWSDAHPSTESAITRPVPCHLIQTPRPDTPEVPVTTTAAAKEGSTSDTNTLDAPLIITISVYSRHILRSTRKTRARAAAEKRYEEFQRNKRSWTDNEKNSIDDVGGEMDRNDRQVYDEDQSETMEKNLFFPKFGAPRDESEEDPRPSQRLEIYSTQTLEELCDGIVCRMDDLPEVEKSSGRSIGCKNRVRYSGRKKAEERAVFIEDCLAGQPGGTLLEHIFRQLSSDPSRTNELRKADLASVRLSDFSGKLCLHKPYWYCHQGVCEHFFTIDEIRLPDPRSDPPPPSVLRSSTGITASPSSMQTGEQQDGVFYSTSKHGRIGFPNWQWNPSSPSKEQQVYRHPLTTFLTASQLDRPTATLARLRGTQESYNLGTCSICEKLTAKFLLVGGERIGTGDRTRTRRRRKRRRSDVGDRSEQGGGAADTIEDGNESEGHGSICLLPSLKNEVEPLCPACLAAMTGHVLPLPPHQRGGSRSDVDLPQQGVDEPTVAVKARKTYVRKKRRPLRAPLDRRDADGRLPSLDTTARYFEAQGEEENEDERDDDEGNDSGLNNNDNDDNDATTLPPSSTSTSFGKIRVRGLPSDVTAENHRRNASIVSDGFNVGWREIQTLLAGSESAQMGGWTIVPLLD